jgi:hypothetical protein
LVRAIIALARAALPEGQPAGKTAQNSWHAVCLNGCDCLVYKRVFKSGSIFAKAQLKKELPCFHVDSCLLL